MNLKSENDNWELKIGASNSEVPFDYTNSSGIEMRITNVSTELVIEMKSKLINKVMIMVFSGILGYTMLINSNYWNNYIFKFIIYGFKDKSAKVISYKNFDTGGYSYSEVIIQIENDWSTNRLILKSTWLGAKDQILSVYVNNKYPKLITCKSNFIIDIWAFSLISIFFIYFVKKVFAIIKEGINIFV